MMRRFVSGKWLRCGYTTGSCASGAAKAATLMALTGEDLSTVVVSTPDGHELTLDVLDISSGNGWASCAVRKDGGDDPDATDQALIYARVELSDNSSNKGIVIDGGFGIGRVTQPGLDQPVGAAAINTVPRRMIERAVLEGWEQAGRVTSERLGQGPDLADTAINPAVAPGLTVIISCPTGEDIAAKTFNPKLGVVGGISILGTTGIVEPMSNAALIETTAREISVLAAGGTRDLVIVVGNYGQSFATTGLGLDLKAISVAKPTPQYGWVKSSNFIGEAITAAAQHGFRRVLVVGHLGKMSKLGIGMLNTHSSVGDGRIETLTACALEAGASLDLLHTLSGCVSTDAVVTALAGADLLEPTMSTLKRRIQDTFDRRTPGRSVEVHAAPTPDDSRLTRPSTPPSTGDEPTGLQLEWVCFTGLNGQYTTVAQSAGSAALIAEWSRS
ncbi:MAG: cobalt-precorrin-5B (C(1))-methyltransferase CbiD [Propionibacteriaceae bacterium]|jgi:cobalt-precorrin-5B (C1)-methyltransferase|nr:cobalt-precorrin-5B (C(1))-methyltransferase CbiD [Propionibacteriaceae bacterium]